MLVNIRALHGLQTSSGQEVSSPHVTLSCTLCDASFFFMLVPLSLQALQLTLLNFARKELMKSEVQQEIRLRSPGGTGLFGGPGQFAGSQYGNGRPSMASIIGHITLQMPTYIKRQISMSSLGPVSNSAVAGG